MPRTASCPRSPGSVTEEKRKIIGREFIRVFRQAARDIVGAHSGADDHPVEFLVQGTLYPDVVESGGGTGTANIKVAPQCRRTARRPAVQVGRAAEAALQGRGAPGRPRTRRPRRHRLAPALPGPGLGIRIVGAVDRERLDILRRPMRSLARNSPAGLDRDIWQCPVVLLADVRSVGSQGDGRTYGHPVVLRPVASEDAMTADWARVPYEVLAKISTRITNEVRARSTGRPSTSPPSRRAPSSGVRAPIGPDSWVGHLDLRSCVGHGESGGEDGMHSLLTALLSLTGAGLALWASAARCATAIVRAARVLAPRPPLRLALYAAGASSCSSRTCWPESSWQPARHPPMSPPCWGPWPGCSGGRRRPGLGIGAIILALTSERVVRPVHGGVTRVVAAVRGATT